MTKCRYRKRNSKKGHNFVKSMKFSAAALFLALAAWLGVELFMNNHALDQWDASQNDVRHSNELLTATRQKHRQMAQNTKADAEKAASGKTVPAREVRVQ